MVKNLPGTQETRVQSPGWGRSPGEGNGNPSSILAWEIWRKSISFWSSVYPSPSLSVPSIPYVLPLLPASLPASLPSSAPFSSQFPNALNLLSSAPVSPFCCLLDSRSSPILCFFNLPSHCPFSPSFCPSLSLIYPLITSLSLCSTAPSLPSHPPPISPSLAPSTTGSQGWTTSWLFSVLAVAGIWGRDKWNLSLNVDIKIKTKTDQLILCWNIPKP